MEYEKAIIAMDSGREVVITGTPLQELYDLLKKYDGDIRDCKPLVFNDKDTGVTTDVIYPNHISHINFVVK